jgi:hypothetical protein
MVVTSTLKITRVATEGAFEYWLPRVLDSIGASIDRAPSRPSTDEQ